MHQRGQTRSNLGNFMAVQLRHFFVVYNYRCSYTSQDSLEATVASDSHTVAGASTIKWSSSNITYIATLSQGHMLCVAIKVRSQVVQ